ncbi:MAG: hypothetical protein DRN15_00275 [Thermoprotei archaeon]|nr:MAG: hypothetical protein DRM97_02390 [Thermoprotei archaeon]RLF25131.1 MAG: hypothetical protein DRN15_00275 [Thermoprotei archaeon]
MMPLFQAILAPIIGAPIVYLLEKRLRLKVGWIAFAILLYSLSMLSMVAVRFLREGAPIVEEFAWAPLVELYFGFRADGLSLPVVLIIAILSTVTAIYSMPYMEHKTGWGVYFALYLLYAAGMMGTVLATNLIEFYLFWELMLVPSYFLIAEWGYGARERVSFKYFIFTHVGALSLLAGILSLYVITGTFQLYEIPIKLRAANISHYVLFWIMVALLIGMFVKMAVWPLHTWLPDAHAEAPTPISVLLSGVMIECGVYAFARFVPLFFPELLLENSHSLMILAVITMFYGGLMALVQTDIKRLLAYSSISQIGYMLFGLSSATALGLIGSIYHIVSHACAKGLLFACAGAIMHQTEGLRDMRRMGGLAKRMPCTALAFLVGVFSLAGMPTLSGFISEFMIFLGGFQGVGYTQRVAVVVIAMLGAALTAAYGLWALRRIFFGQLPDYLKEVKEAPVTMVAPIMALAILSFIFGLIPPLILNFLSAWAEALGL